MSRHLFTEHTLTGRIFKDNPPNEQALNAIKSCGFISFEEYDEWKKSLTKTK